jgi:hypothetical protein
MMRIIAEATLPVPVVHVFVEEDPETRELGLAVVGIRRNWDGRIGLGKTGSIEPGPEHAWIRTQVCEALFTAMGPRGLDSYTQVLIRTSPGWYDVCELANAELGADRVLE